MLGERGPLTVAAFMELALYDPQFGYYARAGQRSGRAGDFFTSVDVGPIFGELLAAQIAEMLSIVHPAGADDQPPSDLVEVGAGNGRLTADIARALKRDRPEIYRRLHLHLVERSPIARAERLATSGDAMPETFEGVLLANELLDAMPVHQVVMTEEGLREVYVARADAHGDGVRRDTLSTVLGPLSTPRLAEYLARVGATLAPGWRAEINLNAIDWIKDAARRLRRGFMILIDYGHEARALYDESHSGGTLTTFAGHRAGDGHAWLNDPGGQDITSHVDWTSVRAAAIDAGMDSIALLDQTYFLLGLLPSIVNPESAARRLKTLLMPGGLGSTMKVLLLGKRVGTPPLLGTSFKVRAT